MANGNGQAVAAIDKAREEIGNNGIHYEDLDQNTKVILFTSDYETGRTIEALKTQLKPLTKAVYFAGVSIGTPLLGTLLWGIAKWLFGISA